MKATSSGQIRSRIPMCGAEPRIIIPVRLELLRSNSEFMLDKIASAFIQYICQASNNQYLSELVSFQYIHSVLGAIYARAPYLHETTNLLRHFAGYDDRPLPGKMSCHSFDHFDASYSRCRPSFDVTQVECTSPGTNRFQSNTTSFRRTWKKDA